MHRRTVPANLRTRTAARCLESTPLRVSGGSASKSGDSRGAEVKDHRTAARERGQREEGQQEEARPAVGETVILMAPPCTFSRCFNRDEQEVSVE